MRRSLPFILAVACFSLPAGDALAAPQNLDDTCGNTRISISFADTVYNAIVNNGESRIGPRRLVAAQSGQIISRGTRLFRGETPMDIGNPTIRLVKTAGRGRTDVTICSTETGGQQRQKVLARFEIPNGRDNIGQAFTRVLTGVRDKRISVRLRGRSITDTMSYNLFVERPDTGDIWEPDPGVFDDVVRPVTGFADLHAHQAAGFAFASGWYHGGMGDGELPPDPISHSRRLTVNLGNLEVQQLRPAHTGMIVPRWNVDSHQQMNANALKGAFDSGLGLMVAQAVNSEWLCSVLSYAKRTNKTQSCNDMEAVKLQILKMKRFDEAHDWYEIVTNPWEARAARGRGHLAVVLGVEVSNLFPTSDGDWRRQLDELYSMGVRQIYISHESNNRFSGTAFHHTEDLKLPNQLTAWFSRDIFYASKPGGRQNAIGLTVLGAQLIQELMRRHMLIDIDHVSWEAVEDIVPITRANAYYPIYAGHTRMNDLLTPAHREIIPELNTTSRTLGFIKESGGMVGLRTGPERAQKYDNSGVPENCGGSVRSLIQHYRYLVDRDVPVAFGSDFNGFVQMTGPRFGPDACPNAPSGRRTTQRNAQVRPSLVGAPPSWSRYAERGMSDIGTEPAVIFDMKKLGVDTTNIESSADAFIRMWTRAYNPNRTRVQTPPTLVPLPFR